MFIEHKSPNRLSVLLEHFQTGQSPNRIKTVEQSLFSNLPLELFANDDDKQKWRSRWRAQLILNPKSLLENNSRIPTSTAVRHLEILLLFENRNRIALESLRDGSDKEPLFRSAGRTRMV